MKFEIVSKDKKFKDSTFKVFNVEGEDLIGVSKNEPFELKFTNDSNHAVQVRFSVDGTDVLTGEPASTKPGGKMFLVRAHDYMTLEAWPEDNNGGARFVFSSADRGVAKNTHGSTAGVGLLAAAVYVEYDSFRYGETWGMVNHNYIRTLSAGNKTGGSSKRLSSRSRRSDKYSFEYAEMPVAAAGDLFSGDTYGSNSINLISEFSREEKLAVGAGEHVEQKLATAQGLRRPVLYDVLQLRYMPWAKLEKIVQQRTVDGSNAFPGDKNQKHIDLKNVPRTPSTARRKQSFGVSRFL